MKNTHNQELINDILSLSKTTDRVLHGKIKTFLDIYEKEKTTTEKLIKENKFFLKKWDKRNILESDTKDKIIEQQSRLAAMGEMIDAVAHQWKQPLNAISMMIDLLKDDFISGNVDNNYMDDLDETIHFQISHMVNTLHEFRSFLRPSTKNENFYISTILENVQVLMKDELISQNLHIHFDVDEDVQTFGNKNELKHLFINLINNSIDAFNENNITEKKISIRCYREERKIHIDVQDNAGGIPTNIINHIFKPHVTTKPEGKGTGIGLYMSAQIVTKSNGNIHVKNHNGGALFSITLRESSI